MANSTAKKIANAVTEAVGQAPAQRRDKLRAAIRDRDLTLLELGRKLVNLQAEAEASLDDREAFDAKEREIAAARYEAAHLQRTNQRDESRLKVVEREVQLEAFKSKTAAALDTVTLLQTRGDAVARALKALLDARDELDKAVCAAGEACGEARDLAEQLGESVPSSLTRDPRGLGLARALLTGRDLGVGIIENQSNRRFAFHLEVPQTDDELLTRVAHAYDVPQAYRFEAHRWSKAQQLADLRIGPEKYLETYARLYAEDAAAAALVPARVAALDAQRRREMEKELVEAGVMGIEKTSLGWE